MPKELSLFERIFFEAPEDKPAAEEPAPDTDNAEIPEEAGSDNAPADDTAEADGASGDTGGAPDMDVDTEDYFGDEEGSGDNTEDDQKSDINLGLDDKVSDIMNSNLYNRFLALLHQISDQLNSIRANADVMYSLTSDVDEMLSMLIKLDENIRLYLNNYFMSENYSKNLLFFNKCLNLLKLLNDSFDSKISKGIKELK